MSTITPRTIDVDDLNGPQLKFVIAILSDVIEELIQDDIILNADGAPAPVAVQTDPTIIKAMKILNYK